MNSDSSIKRMVEHTLQQNPDLDASAIGATVKNGVVTLAGFVPSYPKVSAGVLKKRSAEAFMRDAQVDGNWIRVDVHDDEVVLNDTVHAWFECEEAERLAWSTPGAKKVADKITVMS